MFKPVVIVDFDGHNSTTPTQVASVVKCGQPRTSRTPAALLASVNFTWNLLCQWCPHVNTKL